jgi:hypothetical protein
MSNEPFVFEPFDLPQFDVPQKGHWPAAISWDRAMEEFDAVRRKYLLEVDSSMARLADKNPEPFRLD